MPKPSRRARNVPGDRARAARIKGKSPVALVQMPDVTSQRATDVERELLLQELSQLNAQLEARVGERTAELGRANRELRALSQRLIDAQETERRKVADVLHDDIGQLLTALNSVLKRSRAGRANPNLTEAESIVADLLERVRQLSHNLRPHVLDNLGLVMALRWHVKKFSEQTGIRVTLRLRHVPSGIAPEVATTVFRVVQEALTNVARHSGAQRARVSVIHRDGAFELEIRDNGGGFDPEHLPKDSSGLVNLRERVRLSDGEFTIESRRGRGTTVRATVPVVSTSAREAQ